MGPAGQRAGQRIDRRESGDWPHFYSQLERALRQGSPPPVDARDAIAGLEILDAARRSASTGTVVSLAP